MDNEKKFHFTCARCFNPSFSGLYLVYIYCLECPDGGAPYFIMYYNVKNNTWYTREGTAIDIYIEEDMYWCELPEEVNTYMHNKEDQK